MTNKGKVIQMLAQDAKDGLISHSEHERRYRIVIGASDTAEINEIVEMFEEIPCKAK